MADSLRTTQRAPRSCVACSTRKVKCDKAIPCSTCIRRGTADSCARETVIVRGEVKMAADVPRLPSYDQVWRENERLRTELETLQALQRFPRFPRLSSQPGALRQRRQGGEALEEVLFGRGATEGPPRAAEKLSWAAIAIPSRQCSEQLIAYDKQWNSWAHYATEYPRFDEEHAQFLAALQRGVPLDQMDASWLAVYFSALCAALLLVDDDEARRLPLPDRAHSRLSRHWYDAALFCLHEADFMRRPSVRTVQAVAILGMCFLNFGDTDLYRHLWSCAIRIAQILRLDDPPDDPPDGPPDGPVAAALLSPEAQRRLWWTLVICEWLAVPYHAPQVEEDDFPLVLPVAHPDHGPIQPVHYHIFMARTATVYYRFQAGLRSSASVPAVADVVRRADEDLAQVINTLPAYLQPDDHDAAETISIPQLEATYPWIKWQRFGITLVLLHHRLRLHRVLQQEWLRTPGKYDWARSVCIRSATAIIWISHHWDQPATMRKQWALAMHLFVAALLLFRESKAGEQNGALEFRDDIESAIQQLDEVALQNAIASKAAMLLRNLLDGVSSLDPQAEEDRNRSYSQ